MRCFEVRYALFIFEEVQNDRQTAFIRECVCVIYDTFRDVDFIHHLARYTLA